MTTSIRLLAISAIAVVAMLTAIPSYAQVQYTVGEGFEVVWTLDPRSDPTHFTRGPTFGARSVFTGMDFDGDGNKEFLFTHDETISSPAVDPGFLDLYLYENNGDNSYEYVWHYTHTDASNSFPPVVYGDLDGDSLWEIYLGIPTLPPDSTELFIFEQDDQGVFPATPTATYHYERGGDADFRPSGFQIADVDGDDELELVTISRTANARELVIISPDAGIDAFATFTIEFEAGNAILQGGNLFDVMVVDFDGDGLNEIWVNTWDNWSMSIFEATGPDTYALQVDLDGFNPVNDPGSTNAHDMYFADLEGNDGVLEGYFPMSDGLFYYLPPSTDVSTIVGTDFVTVGAFGARARGAHMGDIDGDGLTDFVATTHSDETIERFEFQGTGSPADSASYEWTTILDSSDPLTTVVVADEVYYPLRITDDLDGDGRNEVVLTNLHASDEGQHIIIILEHATVAPGVERGKAVLDGFTLYPTYPNPFSDRTLVRMELERPGDVTLEVFDVTGRRVRVLDSGMRAAGEHEIEFRADDLPGGLYIVRLMTPSGSLTRTALLVK